MTLEILNTLLNIYKEELNDISKNFISDYSLKDIHYLSDSYTEYADSQTNVYYNHQFDVYTAHSQECEDLLIEYDCDLNEEIKTSTLYQICCKAGALYEYNSYLIELNEDTENIVKCLFLQYLIKNEILMPEEKIKELCDIYADGDYIDSLVDDIKVIINEGEA